MSSTSTKANPLTAHSLDLEKISYASTFGVRVRVKRKCSHRRPKGQRHKQSRNGRLKQPKSLQSNPRIKEGRLFIPPAQKLAQRHNRSRIGARKPKTVHSRRNGAQKPKSMHSSRNGAQKPHSICSINAKSIWISGSLSGSQQHGRSTRYSPLIQTHRL